MNWLNLWTLTEFFEEKVIVLGWGMRDVLDPKVNESETTAIVQKESLYFHNIEHRIYLTALLLVWEGTCTLKSAALLNWTFTGLSGVVKIIKVSRKNCVVSSFVTVEIFPLPSK